MPNKTISLTLTGKESSGLSSIMAATIKSMEGRREHALVLGMLAGVGIRIADLTADIPFDSDETFVLPITVNEARALITVCSSLSSSSFLPLVAGVLLRRIGRLCLQSLDDAGEKCGLESIINGVRASLRDEYVPIDGDDVISILLSGRELFSLSCGMSATIKAFGGEPDHDVLVKMLTSVEDRISKLGERITITSHEVFNFSASINEVRTILTLCSGMVTVMKNDLPGDLVTILRAVGRRCFESLKDLGDPYCEQPVVTDGIQDLQEPIGRKRTENLN